MNRQKDSSAFSKVMKVITDGSTNKEELEKIKNDLHAISPTLQMLSRSGTPAMGRIIYESAAEGYKDWNDQLLDKRMETEEKENIIS